MPAASVARIDGLAPARSADLTEVMTGMTITALLPALFWTSAYAGVAGIFGHEPSTGSLVAIGVAIAAFLTPIYLAIRRRGV